MTEQNINTCWIGAFLKERIVKDLGLDFNPWVIICFGYKKDEFQKIDKEIKFNMQTHEVAVYDKSIEIRNKNEKVNLPIDEAISLQVILRNIFDILLKEQPKPQ